MPGRVASAQKRALTDSTSNNNVLKSPPSAKMSNLIGDGPSVYFSSWQLVSSSFKNKMASSQPKSQFETEVLEKMTQDISGLKQSNAEKDQQWERPSLSGFDSRKDVLRFQAIDLEVGTLQGGKVAIKMFGVSEACLILLPQASY